MNHYYLTGLVLTDLKCVIVLFSSLRKSVKCNLVVFLCSNEFVSVYYFFVCNEFRRRKDELLNRRQEKATHSSR